MCVCVCVCVCVGVESILERKAVRVGGLNGRENRKEVLIDGCNGEGHSCFRWWASMCVMGRGVEGMGMCAS